MDNWARESIPGYDPADPGGAYGNLISQLFLTPEDRQREIEDLCEQCTPSFGYAVLAQMIALYDGRFNVVLTTNFDDLVADALYLYTDARPLVIHHESLARFIRPTRTRPLVVKLHGDHRLSPRNTALETDALEKEIQRHTKMLLHDRGVIFMGYAGADNSVLKLLGHLPPEAVPYGAYWVNPQKPTGQILRWLIDRGGVWVRSGWFDEVMLLAREELRLPHPSRKRFDRIFQEYYLRFQELGDAIKAKPTDAVGLGAMTKALADTEADLPDYWRVLVEAHRLEPVDAEHANEVYAQGVAQFPRAAPLLVTYANFLTRVRKDHDAAELMYQRAMAADPRHDIVLVNYANFHREVKKDYDAAESMYRLALEANPTHAVILGNYALFLTEIRKDHDAAEVMYRRALGANPKDSRILGNFASFFKTVKKDLNAAESLYKWALDVDPRNTSMLSNYASLLTDIRRDQDAAEMHKRALEEDPGHANNLGNYARLLLAIGNPAGFPYLQRATDSPSGTDALKLECAFYLLAHGPPDQRADALRTAKALVLAGVRSPGWILSRNVERARLDGNPDADWLEILASVIADDALVSSLADWPAWSAAAA